MKGGKWKGITRSHGETEAQREGKTKGQKVEKEEGGEKSLTQSSQREIHAAARRCCGGEEAPKGKKGTEGETTPKLPNPRTAHPQRIGKGKEGSQERAASSSRREARAVKGTKRPSGGRGQGAPA